MPTEPSAPPAPDVDAAEVQPDAEPSAPPARAPAIAYGSHHYLPVTTLLREREPVPRESAVVHRGRVVDRAGRPVPDAQVRLIGFLPWDAPRSVRLETGHVLGATRTDRHGRFALSAWPGERGGARFLVAERGSSRRTVRLRTGDRAPTIVLPATRRVIVRIECADLLPEPGRSAPWVEAYSPVAHQAWASKGLRAEGEVWPESILPGIDLFAPAYVRDDARRFAADLDLPPGPVTLVVTGACGDAIRTLTIPRNSSEDVVVHLSMPSEDSGGLHVRSTTIRPMGDYRPFVELWSGPRYGRRLYIDGESAHLERLPPGRYRIGVQNSVRRCWRTVWIRPRQVTEFELDGASCLIYWY